MKKIILIAFMISFTISCKKGNKATYSVDENYKKIDEVQYLEEVSSKNEVSNKKLSSDFSYKKYYELLIEKIDNVTDDELINMVKTVSNYCSTETINTQIQIIEKVSKRQIDTTSINQADLYTLLLKQELNLLKKCPPQTSINVDTVKKISATIFKLNSSEITKNLDLVIDIDKTISTKGFSKTSYSSFSAAELKELIYKVLETNNISQITKLVKLHKKISPVSVFERSALIEKAFNASNGTEVIKTSSLESLISFLKEYSSIKTNHKQDKVKATLKVVIKKFSKKYDKITRFEDISEVLTKSWEEYTQIFDILNSEIIKDKSYTILTFNKLNLIVEKIYELPINRSPAINFLESISSRYENLALFHLTRSRSTGDKSKLLKMYPNVEKDSLYNNILDQLLKLRIMTHSKINQSERIENYCYFLNEINFKNKDYKIVKDIKTTINNRNTFGCFEIKMDENRLSFKEKQNDKKHNLDIKLSNIKSPIDMIIRVFDTDVKIETNYYNGPMWYLPTKRKHKQRKIKISDLNSSTSILVVDVNYNGQPNNNFKILYNYDFKNGQTPETEQSYLNGKKLFKGYSGGNLEVKVSSTKSIYPSLLSIGGEGQDGPDEINPGKAISSDKIFNSLFSEQNHKFYEDLIFKDGNNALQPTQLMEIQNYQPSYVVNKELTLKLHNDLCNQKKTNLMELCYISGNNFEYRKLKSNQLGYLGKTVTDELQYAAKIMMNKSLLTEIIEEKFSFPPPERHALGDTTIFKKGENGDFGSTDFIIEK